MTKSKIVSRLVSDVPVIIDLMFDGRLEHSRCVMATAVGVDVLAAFNIEARPLSVKIDLLNRAYVEFLNGTLAGDPESHGAWRLTGGDPSLEDRLTAKTQVPQPVKPWHGHLVVEIPAMEMLVDLDLRQMNRPQKQIVLPSAAGFRWDGVSGAYVVNGNVMQYVARRDDVSWEEAPDWKYRQTRWPVCVSACVRSITERRQPWRQGKGYDALNGVLTHGVVVRKSATSREA